MAVLHCNLAYRRPPGRQLKTNSCLRLFSFAVPVTTADPAVKADPIATHSYLMAELRRLKRVQHTPSVAVLLLAAVAAMTALLPLCARAEGKVYMIVVVSRDKTRAYCRCVGTVNRSILNCWFLCESCCRRHVMYALRLDPVCFIQCTQIWTVNINIPSNCFMMQTVSLTLVVL